jgi:hypothetical protein
VRLADYLVAGGLHQDLPVLTRRESDGGSDIGRALRHHDHRGHQLVIQVPDGAYWDFTENAIKPEKDRRFSCKSSS